jgi:hypothetical protein
MSTSLAAALAALELGHLEPRAEDLSGMAPPPTEALEQTVTAIWSDLFTTMSNTSIERDIEDLAWGLVNLFHRAAAKKHGLVDRLTDDIRLLLAEQDGSEISTANLEEKIDLAKKVEDLRVPSKSCAMSPPRTISGKPGDRGCHRPATAFRSVSPPGSSMATPSCGRAASGL